jgi:hypothetical protein
MMVMRSSISKLSLLLSSFIVTAALCGAASITYDVNLTVGGGGVTGYIVTDGIIGANPNIIDWNLLLNDGTNTFDLLGPLSGPNSPPDTLGYNSTGLTASATELLFSFSGAGVLFWNYASSDFLCFGPLNCLDGTISGNGEELVVGNFANLQLTNLSGTQVIAGAPTGPSTPEPSTFALLGLGIVLCGFRKLRHKQERGCIGSDI